MGLSREKGYPDKRPYRNALEKSARCQRALALGEMSRQSNTLLTAKVAHG